MFAKLLSCENSLKELELFSGRREGVGDTLLWPSSKTAGEGCVTRACRDRTKGNDFKLKAGRSRLDIREFFPERVVRLWDRFPRELTDAPSLKYSKLG